MKTIKMYKQNTETPERRATKERMEKPLRRHI
jgi:hypothetical protein